MPKPVLPLIHSLSRSGTTVICKCLGSMDGVLLLSEINPRGVGYPAFNPIAQADHWYRLFTPDDLDRLKNAPNVAFDESIALIYQRCRDRGLQLVLRDWNHLDFMCQPFDLSPVDRMMLVESLQHRFDFRRIAVVRHPLDQVESLLRKWSWATLPDVAAMLHSARVFAEQINQLRLRVYRYEDFASAPSDVLRSMCDELGLVFDSSYETKWRTFDKITGDKLGSRGGTETIRPVARNPVPIKIMDQFRANQDYRRICALLGYEIG